MTVTKRDIQNGIVQYLENDVVKAIGDKPVMMGAAVLTGMIKGDDSMVDRALENPIVAVLLKKNDDGTYDLDPLFEAINNVIKEYGNFELKIPFLKQPFVFNADDFKNLKSYIEGDKHV